jgi:prepilin-type processing-associated H-X9-DG protein
VYRRSRAFTLAELLTVLAITLVLAGLLFPVFVSAKSAAKKTQCLSNMRQTQLATDLYMPDYDEYFMPVNHRPASPPDSKFDRTWVQLLLPYAKSFGIFSCPSDTGVKERAETTFDQDLVPGDVYSQYYTASMRTNMGYNYLYLAPIVMRNGRWVSEPRSLMDISDTSKTLLFVDSVWDRNPRGEPFGGGNWIVVPPCRYSSLNPPRDTFSNAPLVYSPFTGWDSLDPNSGHIYGNAWPWHSGRVNIVRVDGSATSIPVKMLTKGCNLRERWRGLISDSGEYMWDIR